MRTREEYPCIELESVSEMSNLEELTHSNSPELIMQEFKITVPKIRLRTSTSEAKNLLENMREQTAMVVALWPEQFKTTRELEREVKVLQQKVMKDEMEIMDMKRKRWCSYCENEATYLAKCRRYFYCSRRCEKKHTKRQKKQMMKAAAKTSQEIVMNRLN